MKFTKGKTSGREDRHGNVQGPGDWRMMLMDSKLKLPHALRGKQASSFLHCIRRNVAKSSEDMILPLYSALMKSYMECCV